MDRTECEKGQVDTQKVSKSQGGHIRARASKSLGRHTQARGIEIQDQRMQTRGLAGTRVGAHKGGGWWE